MSEQAQVLSVPAVAAPSKRWWLHGALLAATILTTTVVGTQFQHSFQINQAPFSDESLKGWFDLLQTPGFWLSGLPFSLSLLTILFAHEMGHYLACLFYSVDASLPYFLPAPTLIGTLGAFIRIRSQIFKRDVLFDIGIAGPLAGLAVLLPVFAIGIAYSKVVPINPNNGDLVFGASLLQHALQSLILPGVPSGDILLNPIARGAWVGVFATALNLLPVGQLDGGHILYAMLGERHRLITNLTLAVLVVLGFLYKPWWIWAVGLFFLGRKHPFLYDPEQLSPARRALGIFAFVVFLLCFTPDPFPGTEFLPWR